MESSYIFHPGELIKEEVEARNMTQKQLAQQMGMSYTALNDIVRGRRGINTECALLLEAALGIEANLWLRMQCEHDMRRAKLNTSFMERLKNIRKIAAVF